jgi:bifunctional non-homologous end joining protein LigD
VPVPNGRKAGIVYNEHLDGDGAEIFDHACRLGLEGVVSKRRDLPHRSGRVKSWLKIKNPEEQGHVASFS